MSLPNRGTRWSVALGVAFAALAAGCQQRMAEQPSPRPFERSAMFPHDQSARPLERGVVHRNQAVEGDPLVTWLTKAGREGRSDEKFMEGAAAFDPKSIVPPLGAPDKIENFVAVFPFEMTEADLKRGQTIFNTACALCHGAAGYGNGKIPERGFLRPPSYHTDPAGKAMDWSTLRDDGTPAYSGLPAGYSRGFNRYGVKYKYRKGERDEKGVVVTEEKEDPYGVPLRSAPVGYIFQVITWGYGGMGSHEVQTANPADRWRLVAYVRTLQLSQAVPEGELPAEARAELNKAGGKQ
jgi:hypothetical protein